MEPKYYDRNGEEIDVEKWSELFGQMDYKIIKRSTVGDKWISTVWLGLDHSWDDEPIQIFETMVFPDDGSYDDLYCKRYENEEQALEDHQFVVSEIERNGGKDILYNAEAGQTTLQQED